MSPAPERRRLTRVATSIAATLELEGAPPVELTLEDLSVIGLRARAPRELDVGSRSPCRVHLRTAARTLTASGRIVRARGGELAIGFDQLAFEDYELLRTFLLEHAADPRALGDELEDRLGYLG